MNSFKLHDLWLVLAGAIGTIIIAVTFLGPLNIPWNKPRTPAIKVVTADVDGLIRQHTLILASTHQNDAALTDAIEAWRGDLASKLEAFARQNNLVILPAGAGIFGASDITDQVIKIFPAPSHQYQQGGQP